MTALTAIVPSRGRPQAVPELIDAFQATCQADTRLIVAVDSDDPTLAEYTERINGHLLAGLPPHSLPAGLFVGPSNSTMVKTLNVAAGFYAPQTYAIAFMGDDHRPRTEGWDIEYLRYLRGMGTGIVYGNDLLQGEAIPTQVAMTADIVNTLGHMAPAGLTHLFVDNYWRDLGNGAGCLAYLPDVVVEHLHPFAGKAPLDEGYHRVNNTRMYATDGAAYQEYSGYHLRSDIAKVRALRHTGPVPA